MARHKKPRTLTLSDEVFDGLQALAQFRRLKGDKTASASSIVEMLAADFLKDYEAEISLIKSGKAAMNDKIQRQLSLFDFDGTFDSDAK